MKKGSVSPLYLHLACEELRNYASFEKVNYCQIISFFLVTYIMLFSQVKYIYIALFTI